MIAILLIVASLVASSIAQPVTYSFCSIAYSNVAGSPALPWSVQTSGTLTLTQSTNGLYQVTDAAGYRLIHTRGQTSNQTITGVSPIGSYHHNDNLVSIASPYLSNDHSFALRFGSAVEAVYFTSSEVNVLFKNNSIDIVQVDLPRNDGLINNITSTFTMVAGSSPSCPTLPMYPVSASALAAFNTRQTIPFCYAFSGGPGDGTPDQTLWTVTASGNFIISGLAGNSSNGGQTFIVLGVEGTRSYVDMYYNVVNRFLSISPSSAAFSTKYPNFDDVGLTMRFDSALFYWNGNSSSRLATIVVDSAFMFNELIGEARNIPNVVGNFDVQTPGDTKPLQCGFDAGSLAQYQFCYRMRDPANVWDIVTYGQFTATGPVIRKDLSALTMHGMTGVRTVTNAAGRYAQNIIKLVYVNGVNASSGSTILNNNIVYVEGALPLDYYGMTYTLSAPAVFPDAVSPTADINLSAGSSKWYEWPVGAGDMEGVDPQHAGGYFNFNATEIVGEDYFPCDNSVTVPAMKRFYFCYQIATADYTIQASGMILAFGANITFEGRTGYAIANMTGARSFTRNGVTTYSAILSSNSESWGAINNTYSKILYPVAPHLDSLGVVIHVGADADTPLGLLVGEKVFDLSVGTNGNLTELGFTSGGPYSGVGWMMITEDASKVACQVNPTSNSASAVATSVLSVLLMVVVALAL